MNKFNDKLTSAIAVALRKAEEEEKIVITTSILTDVAKDVAEEVKSAYAGGVLSPDEIFGLCVVLLHAVEDKKFFDWEMPTLSGFKAEEIKRLAIKLRDSVNI
jgi:hypothetical protein